MILLAFDTSLAACSAAVAIDSSIASSRFEPMERGHAEALAPMIRAVAAEAWIAFGRIERIAVTRGPGSFTGVRIGLAMARGMALALGVPIVGIDTLAAIAANHDEPVVVASDARRDEIYLGLPGEAPRIVSLAEAGGLLPSGPLRIVGTGADKLVEAAGRADLIRIHGNDLPVAARFALRALQLVPQATPPEPIYLRPPDAKPQALPIRPALAAEAPLLAAIHAECFESAWEAADLARLMAMPGAVTFLAQQGAEPIGFILMRRAADEAEIVTLATRPMARRRGTASRLIAAATAALSGVDHVFIEVARNNAAARALYAKLGFRPAGTRKGYYQHTDGSREDAIVMRKDAAA